MTEPQQQQIAPATAPVDAPAVTPEPQTPPWGEDENFDPERAWKLIQDLRADKEKLTARPALTDEQQQQLAEYKKLVEASKTDQERQAEELSRWQTDAQKWRGEAVAARVQALAAIDFTDPSDAVAAVDPNSYIDAGGQIDEAAIQRDLAAVLERKPHWRRTSDGIPAPRVPAPNPAQGAGGGSTPADPASQFAAILQAQMRNH